MLGEIIEKVSGMPYAESLSQRIFSPLGMHTSYFYGYADKKTAPIAPLYVSGVDVSTSKSLSCDWSGGGIISTTDDLLLFQTALNEGVFGDIQAEQANYPHKFQPGIHYGFGMMEIHFKEFFFLLKDMPALKGHIGVTATHMFYDETNDVHFIMNFGSDKRMVESFRTLIKIVQILKLKA